MKLSEILEDYEKRKQVMDWLGHYLSGGENSAEYFNKHIDQAGEITLKLRRVGLSSKESSLVYDPPFSVDWFGENVDTFQFSGSGNGSNVINSFEKIPNVEFLGLSETTLHSLKGIERLTNLKTIHLQKDIFFNCGLLRLLKLPNKVRFAKDHDFEDNYPRFGKALKILITHIECDKNVIDCQNELIDAGLEVYAKL